LQEENILYQAGEIQRLNVNGSTGVYTDESFTALGARARPHCPPPVPGAGSVDSYPLGKEPRKHSGETVGPILTIIFVALVLLMVAVAYVADHWGS